MGDARAHLAQDGRGPILNPVSLPAERKLSVCLQYHLEGEIAVKQPRRDLQMFKAGDDLSEMFTSSCTKERQDPTAVPSVSPAMQARTLRRAIIRMCRIVRSATWRARRFGLAYAQLAASGQPDAIYEARRLLEDAEHKERGTSELQTDTEIHGQLASMYLQACDKGRAMQEYQAAFDADAQHRRRGRPGCT